MILIEFVLLGGEGRVECGMWNAIVMISWMKDEGEVMGC